MVLLVVNLNLSVGENDIARVVFPFVTEDRHQSQLSAALKIFRDRRKWDRQIGIAVEHEKLFAQLRHRALQGAACSQQRRSIKRVIKLHAVRRAIAEIALHHLAEMPETKHRAADAFLAEQLK